MESKEKIISVMQELSDELNRNHRGSETAEYVASKLRELQKSDGVAFTGVMQEFINKGSLVKMADNIKFTAKERELWNKARSFNELGNNLWGASL